MHEQMAPETSLHLAPLSTEFKSDKIDSAVAMSAESDGFKSGETRQMGTNGSSLTNSAHDGQAQSPNTPPTSDISNLVKNLQRILSSSNATFNLNITSNTDTKPPEESAKAVDGTCNGNESSCQCLPCVEKRKQAANPITYAVEYLDVENRVVSKEIRKTAYELDDELRQAYVPKVESAFIVTTVLKTSIPTDEYREFRAREEGPSNKQMIKSKDFTTSFHTVKLTIQSPVILDVLREHVLHYPGLSLWGSQVTVTSPFSALAHHLEHLRDNRNSPTPVTDEKLPTHADEKQNGLSPQNQCKPTKSDSKPELPINMLLEYLEKVYGNTIEAEIERNKRGCCTFAMLWHLFQPGMTVYVPSEKAGEAPSAMVVSKVTVDPEMLYQDDGERDAYILDLWCLDFDGHLVGRGEQKWEISKFDGEKLIVDLEVIPCKYIDEKDEETASKDKDFVTTRRRLVELGKTWFGALTGKMVLYHGEFPESQFTDAFSGRVYVDCASYWAAMREDRVDRDDDDKIPGPKVFHYSDNVSGLPPGGCSCDVCRKKLQGVKCGPFDGYWKIDPDVTKSLELDESQWNSTLGIDKDHRYLICSHILGGLDLKNRRWEKLNVAYFSDSAPKSKAIENLVMRDSRKDLIKSLLYNYSKTKSHNAPKSWNADFIENKGDGRIFLLHGPPGVGKTYTAECIAEYTGRPLLSLTCGDIGISEQAVDKNLRKWFTIGEKWGALILVDEADVYLESRQPGDVKRNGLVSVFLRAVEYYKGILFLTTNRVGHFDEAFISRIHVVLKYEKLTPDDRKKIWKGFFDKLERERGKQIRISKSAKKYVLEDKEMTNIPWNGREIRNAFQTAVALAQYKFVTSEDDEGDEKAVLDRDHFEEVCKMTTDFKKYLKKLHRSTEDERAERAKDRYDAEDAEDSEED